MLIVDKHCGDVPSYVFQVPQIDRKSKQVNSDMKNFVCNQYGKKLTILNTENIKVVDE